MKISYKWLKEYVNINLSPEEIDQLLTDTGLEVEGWESIESIRGGLKGVVIGKVLTCVKHPDADRLSITTVNIGQTEPLHIVCGAPNVAAGQKVAVATIGTTLYSGEESFVIKKSKIRGELSEGMICAEDELGLGESHAGIMILDPDAVIGTPANEYFGIENDIVFEIGLTPNRSDATSHIGVARDIVAALNLKPEYKDLKLNYPSVDLFKTENQNLTILVDVEDVKACPRYSGITISGIKVTDSPDWLQNRLKAIGLRPINNVVDITNFVLMEIGQPLHAFDAKQIKGGKVVVKKLAENTPFITLDGVERKLTANDLMICNAEEGMCIAGVFGGAKSGVTNETTNIFIESACFDPVHIRKTSKYHGLKTDASFRYERGTDPNITLYALKRAALLIKEIAGGKISSEIVDIYPIPFPEKIVQLSLERMKNLIGKELPKETILYILTLLEMDVKAEEEGILTLSVPHYRTDVTRDVDVIEDILRIYGYNNIEIGPVLKASMNNFPKPDPEQMRNLISDYLASNGFFEIMNNSLTKSEYTQKFSYFKAEENVPIANPLSKELDVMRQTLLFGALETVIYNINRKVNRQKLFEFGRIYRKTGETDIRLDVTRRYREEHHLAILMTGTIESENWHSKEQKPAFFHLKAYVENLLSRIRFPFSLNDFQESTSGYFAQGLQLMSGNKVVGEFGILHPSLLKTFDIKQDVLYAELNWDLILKKLPKTNICYKEVSKYPEVRRDLALLLDKEISFAQISQIAYQTEKMLLKKVNLFDVYEGDKLEAGKKSYAVSFILQDEEKTLTDNQIEKIMEKMVKNFETQLGAKLR